MNQYWYNVETFEHKGMEAVLDWTYDDTAIGYSFDSEFFDIEDMENKVNNVDAYWALARLRLSLNGAELACYYLGGIYTENDIYQELIEYYKEDMLAEAEWEVKEYLNTNLDKLIKLNEEL